MPLGLKLPVSIAVPAWMRGGAAVRRRPWSWLEPKYAPLAFELDTRVLSMVRVARRKQDRYLAAFDVEEVPPDLVEIDFLKARITSQERYRALVSKILSRDPVKLKSVSLVVPDSYARVAVLPFEQMPRNRQDTLDLIRYKTKKAVPFKVEEAALDYQVLGGAKGAFSVLAVLMPKSIIEEFEAVFASFGMDVGLIDLATFSLVNAYRPVFAREMEKGAEYLVANVTGTYFSFAVFRGGDLIFFRCKPFAAGIGDDGGEGALRLLKRELQTSVLYYRDKLDGKGLTRSYLRVVDLDRAAVAALFEAEPDAGTLAAIDVGRVVSANGRVTGEQGERTLARLAPAIGAAAGRMRA